jgi:hypothetical protein
VETAWVDVAMSVSRGSAYGNGTMRRMFLFDAKRGRDPSLAIMPTSLLLEADVNFVEKGLISRQN